MRAGSTVQLASRPAPTSSPTASPNWSRSRACTPAESSGISGTSPGRLAATDEPLLLLDLLLQLHQPLGERLGTRWAPGHVDVDRDHLVDAVAHRVRELEEAATVGAAAHRH